MMKKAQVAGQVFIFILAAVIAILTLLYGYNAIFGKSGIVTRAEEIAEINFRTEVETQIRTIASDFGRVKKLELSLPGKAEQLCIIDLNQRDKAVTSPICSPNNLAYQPEVCDAWKTEGYQNNIFLLPLSPFRAVPLHLDDGFLCVQPVGIKITLRLHGLGDATNVSEWIRP